MWSTMVLMEPWSGNIKYTRAGASDSEKFLIG